MPDRLERTLRAEVIRTARRAIHFRAEFQRLAADLARQRVPLMALKGLHLGHLVYASPALRSMSDWDVMVPEAHLGRAAAVVRAMGYAPLQDLKAAQTELEGHHLPRMAKAGLGVEIHWRLADEDVPPLTSGDELWQRARPFPGVPNGWVLCPEDSLIHVCSHAALAHLLTFGLRPLCDVQALVRNHGDALDWNAIAARANAWRCERAVAATLALTSECLGLELPKRAESLVAAAGPPADVLRLMREQLLHPEQYSDAITESAGRVLLGASGGSGVRHAWNRLRRTSPHLQAAYPDAEPLHGLKRAAVAARRARVLTRRYAGRLIELAVTTPESSPARRHMHDRHTMATWLRAG